MFLSFVYLLLDLGILSFSQRSFLALEAHFHHGKQIFSHTHACLWSRAGNSLSLMIGLGVLTGVKVGEYHLMTAVEVSHDMCLVALMVEVGRERLMVQTQQVYEWASLKLALLVWTELEVEGAKVHQSEWRCQ